MNETSNFPSSIILPPRLRKGDTIGLVAPAGPILNEENFHAGVRLLREYGFEVKYSRKITRSNGYLAGSDIERAEEFEELWADDDVKAILAVRGGYGSFRILPLLNMDLFRSHPKLFVGFSDICFLHNAIFKHTGLVTFHGPMLTTLPKADKNSVQSFFEALTQREPSVVPNKGIEILVEGSAKGKLLGGNLACMTHLLATPYDLPWADCILFFEDVNEAPYRIDRMLTQLKTAGKFNNVAGILLGSFNDCGDQELVWERVLNLVDAKIPVWANFPIGHEEQNYTLPIGVKIEMDGNSGALNFLEPCVS